MKARLYLLSTVSALALAGSAFAAEAPPPVVVAAPTWTGFYVGGHAGFAWLRHSDNVTLNGPFVFSICTAGAANTQSCNLKDTGAVAGGQIGYNWQQNNLVFGIEADGSWTGLRRRRASRPCLTAP